MIKLYNLLGLAMRSGSVSSGAMAVKDSIFRKKACLLIISSDISEKTKSSLMAHCQEHNLPCFTAGDKFCLGKAIGKAYRVAVTVNEEGIAKAIMKALAAGDEPNTTGVVEWPK